MKKIKNDDIKLNNNEIVKVHNLTCIFNEKQKNKVVALNKINLSLEKNKIHFIIGNSGSGKSTLVFHFNGLLKSKKGILNIDNFYIDEKKNKIKKPKILRKIVSMVFQFPEYQLFKDTIEKDICFGPKVLNIPKNKYFTYHKTNVMKGIKSNSILETKILNKFKINSIDDKFSKFKFKYYPTDDLNSTKVIIKYKFKKIVSIFNYKYMSIEDISKSDAEFYLNKMGLDSSYLKKNPFGLSGGQKRRVAIAGILAIEPKILIFDEPTAGLDPKGEEEMMNIILDAKKRNQTVIVITHTMDHVLQIADNLIVLKEGQIFLQGDPYDVFTNPKLYKETQMNPPKIIDLINKLSSKNKKYNKLYKIKPRNIDDLANAIEKIKKEK